MFSDARDERRGWMGDASLTSNQALYNFDLIKFYHNFLNLLVDDQLDNGELPNYVPVGNGPNPGWSSNYPPDTNWVFFIRLIIVFIINIYIYLGHCIADNSLASLSTL